MSSIDQRRRELDDIKAVRHISSALLEVSSEKIKKLRVAFETNRRFYTEVGSLYATLKLVASQHELLSGELTRKPSVAAVAVTSNNRFYGSLNRTVADAFREQVRSQGWDAVVIGNTGREYLESVPLERPTRFIIFRDDRPSENEVKSFLDMLGAYDQVLVFYPTFVNVFYQEVSALDITFTPSIREVTGEPMELILEPELPKILKFFKTRVRYILFERVMLESELARTAARLMTMSSAERNAKEFIRVTERKLKKEQAAIENMALLESIAGVRTWRT